MNFPILTFDEAKLAPSWGYVFVARWLEPCESVVSMLLKLVWINRLAGHSAIRSQSGIPTYSESGAAVLRALHGPWLSQRGASIGWCASVPDSCRFA
jgi:hypothetical protein